MQSEFTGRLSRGVVLVLGTASAAATAWAFGRGSFRLGMVGCIWVALHVAIGWHLARRPERARRWDRFLVRLGPTGLLGAAWTALPAIVGTLLLVGIGPLSDALRRDPAAGLALYVVVFVLSAGVGLLPSSAQAVLAGWVFGPIYGFAVALAATIAGFAGASAIGYGIARRVSRDRVEEVFREHPRWEAIRRALIGRGFWKTTGIVALVRIPRTSPFALTNLVLAASGVRLGPYVAGTVLGMLPRTAIPVWLADRASRTGARDIQQFLSEGPGWPTLVLGIAAMVVLLAVLGDAAKRALRRVTRAQREAVEAAQAVHAAHAAQSPVRGSASRGPNASTSRR